MIKLIPQPYKYSYEAGSFNFLKGFTLNYPDVWQNEVDNFVTFAQSQGLNSNADSLNSIDIVMSDRLAREGYLMNIGDNNITISASTSAGCFYALTSLKQLIVAYSSIIPCFQIEDRPRFNYRGFMLDVGRYFYSVQEVKQYLDLMAMHKLNYFHWHLTEDQGWRIEIKKYPLLTEKSSRRSHTNFNMREHKGYYTQDEIREIVEYAHSLHIKVIPEIDMPGHMQAALHAYKELGCFNRKLPVATHWGVKHDILCGGKPEVRQFIKDIIDEIVELFPDKFIHVGGDEAVKTRWRICPHCQDEMRRLGLKNEDELQAEFISDINSYIRTKGYSTIMWNEDAPTGRLSTDIIWMAWNVSPEKHEMLHNELKKDRLVINASSEPNYLDLPYSINSLDRVYTQELNFVEANKCMIGVEAPLWTEFVPNMKNAYRKMFPRLGAVAEAAWSEEKNKDIEAFKKKIPAYYDMLKAYGVTNLPTAKIYNPNKVRAICQRIWWEKRQLTWHGLHNLIDNAKVKHMVKREHPEMFEEKSKK